MSIFNKKHKPEVRREFDLSNSSDYDPKAYKPIFIFTFDGEKTPGEIGNIIDYRPDYYALRARSWQSYLESEITQTVIGKLAKWVIGSGLKLQSEPEFGLIEGLEKDAEFVRKIESMFKLVVNSYVSDFTNNDNLHVLAEVAYINAVIGGDVLCILRSNNDGSVSAQLIDGAHVTSFGAKKNKNNRLDWGVERNKKGKHVAYHVRTMKGTERIKAYDGSNNFKMAFLIYGLKYRMDEVRGISLLSAMLETLKKLDRYKEAAVGSAEELAKIAYFMEHGQSSTGENPLIRQMAQAANAGIGDAKETEVTDNDAFATKVATTVQKSVINLPNNSTIKTISPHTTELNYPDFLTANINLVAAAMQIPPEVAMSMYNSNFSASRAAIKDWEHSLKVNRKKFSDSYYKNYYNLWLTVQSMGGKLNFPAYTKAILTGDIMTILACQNARFVGANVPHIDPLKEVKALRALLGNDNIPLISHEEAVEAITSGDWFAVIEKYKHEIETSDIIPQSSNIKLEENDESNND